MAKGREILPQNKGFFTKGTRFKSFILEQSLGEVNVGARVDQFQQKKNCAIENDYTQQSEANLGPRKAV